VGIKPWKHSAGVMAKVSHMMSLNCFCHLRKIVFNRVGLDHFEQEGVAHAQIDHIHCHSNLEHFVGGLIEEDGVSQLEL
jgi:hypothetical protein